MEMTVVPCPEGFFLSRYEVTLEAGPGGLHLPPYKGSFLRGGLACSFRRLVCGRPEAECRTCLLRHNCPYALVFESGPSPDAQALRLYENVPQPFVLEPPWDGRTTYDPGDRLAFGLTLVGRAVQLLPYFIVSLEEWGRFGLGRGRRPFAMLEVAARNPLTGDREVVFRAPERTVRDPGWVVRAEDLWEEAPGPPEQEMTLGFLTPVRVLHEGRLAARPEFHVLIRNLLRRVSALYYFYHGRAYEADFAEIIRRAAAVELVRDLTMWVDWERYSGRQDRRMKMGGFVGRAVYRGPIAAFRGLLRLGELIHLGKGAVFGLGKVRLSPGRPDSPPRS